MNLPTKNKWHEFETRTAILEMKMAGFTLQDICNQLQLDGQEVNRHLNMALREAREIMAGLQDKFLTLELLKLEKLDKANWPTALAGDRHAIESALKISVRRCKLLGLDAPTRTEVLARLAPAAGQASHRPDLSGLSVAELETLEALLVKAQRRGVTAGEGTVVDVEYAEAPAEEPVLQ